MNDVDKEIGDLNNEVLRLREDRIKYMLALQKCKNQRNEYIASVYSRPEISSWSDIIEGYDLQIQKILEGSLYETE